MKAAKHLDKIYNLITNKIFILVLGVFLLSIVSFLGLPMGNDEGTWAFMGRVWVDEGILPYSGTVESKTPFVYLVFALSHLLFGINVWFPRFLAIIFVVLSGLVLYDITKRLSEKRAALFALIIFMLTMPLASVDGGFAETETFMNLFRLLSVWFVLLAYVAKSKNKAALWIILSGASFGAAVSTKQIALLDAFPLLAFHVYLGGKQFGFLFKQFLLSAVGGVLAMVLIYLPILWSGGTWQDYYEGAWQILFGITAGSAITRISGFFRHFFNDKLWFLTATLLGFVVLKDKLKNKISLYIPILVWALSDFVMYNAQGRYLDHHYKSFIPSWAIVFGIVISFVIGKIMLTEQGIGGKVIKPHLKDKKNQKILTVGVILSLLLFYIPFETNYYHTTRKYLKNLNEAPMKDLGIYAKEITNPEDYIYHWGIHNGQIYYYSERSAPGRYFSSYFVENPGAVEEITNSFAKNKPEIILIPVETEASIPEWFFEYLHSNYDFEATKYRHNVYRQL